MRAGKRIELERAGTAMSSLKSLDGYLMIDHRVAPGMPEEVVRKAGIDTPAVGAGKVFECATLTCYHCATVVIQNPMRKRARNYCGKCDRYICDACGAAAAMPGYEHRSFKEVVDMVKSGRYIVSGSPSAPVLTIAGESLV